MKSGILFIFLSILVGSVLGAIYRSVDDQGNVTFSDQPNGVSEAVELPPVMTYPAPSFPASSPPVSDKSDKKPAPGYENFAVVSPGQDQAFWDGAGNVQVKLSLSPGLRTDAGHRVVFYLDGQSGGEPDTTLEKIFRTVDRGQHTVSAAIVDAGGAVIIETEKVTFQLHRAAVPQPPPPPPKKK